MLNFVKNWYRIFNYFCSTAMTLSFFKYQGTGNDFIMLNNTSGIYDKLSIADIQQLCDRKFGIGADGLIAIQNHSAHDFEMHYYNADGTQSFCGNGARCAVAFAGSLGLLKGPHTQFLAIDGVHQAWLCEDEVKLKMSDVEPIQNLENSFIVQTGSPHCVLLDHIHTHGHVTEIGRAIRYNERFEKDGINVNLMEITADGIRVATYERGVEDETLSCGTGVTAAALVYAQLQDLQKGAVEVLTKGGQLQVQWQLNSDHSYTEVYLTGPAKLVYNGNYELKG
jgi:diaminopimelate epimerase